MNSRATVESHRDLKSLRRLSRKIIPALIFISITGLFFRQLIFGNLILARGDTFLYFYPYWHQAAEALRIGKVPLWNPNLFMGAPFLANSQSGFFYPLNWPFWLLLPTPYAVSASILLHIMIAGLGIYLVARRCLSLSGQASLVSAILFALGGYFTAKVEHINQLQGLAWLPWYWVVICQCRLMKGEWRSTLKTLAGLAGLIAMQVLAGHLQTAFISLVSVTVWLLVKSLFTSRQRVAADRSNENFHNRLTTFIFAMFLLLLAGLLASLLTGAQLLPTLELSLQSSRQGGLPVNEALSFSLHPLLLSRSLLPDFSQSLFTEYIAVLPVTALFLAMLGAWSVRERPDILPFIIITISGLFLAFGIFNPIYHIMVRFPGFDLFRVPARWLVLYAFGVALIAGVGWDLVLVSQPHHVNPSKVKKPLISGVLVIIFLIIWQIVAVPLARFIPVGAEASVRLPSVITLLGQSLETLLAFSLLGGIAYFSRRDRLRTTILAVVLITVMLAESRILPYSNPTSPEAFFGIRPPAARLQALKDCEEVEEDCTNHTGRFLSLSDILFDIGDQPEIDTIYREQLSDQARYDYTVAIKQKEIIGPNLPMVYDLESVDGFDGGVLPLKSYVEMMSLVLPDDEQTKDGRLREYLTKVPEGRWLDLFNVQYIITDKVGDSWRREVFFDLQMPITLTHKIPSVNIGYIPPFEATELWLLARGEPGTIKINNIDGRVWRIKTERLEPDLYRAQFPESSTGPSIEIFRCDLESHEDGNCPNDWQLLGLALVDIRDGSFRSLVPGNYQLLHSGDVKIFQNLDALPRAFTVSKWMTLKDQEVILNQMRQDEFDPSELALIHGGSVTKNSGDGQSSAIITKYEPERVVVEIESKSDSFLILTDAYYPGWKATLNGEPAPIYKADLMFRGVAVPAGQHEVEFTYEPASYRLGKIFSLAGLLLITIFLVIAYRLPKKT